MMFDHGCDSLGVLFGTFTAGSLFNIGTSVETLMVYLFTINCFYFANLEGSKLHGMHLPVKIDYFRNSMDQMKEILELLVY